MAGGNTEGRVQSAQTKMAGWCRLGDLFGQIFKEGAVNKFVNKETVYRGSTLEKKRRSHADQEGSYCKAFAAIHQRDASSKFCAVGEPQ